MTREEARKEFWKVSRDGEAGVFEKGLDIQYKNVIKSYYIGSEFDKFIDKIFNDFENRKCETCIKNISFECEIFNKLTFGHDEFGCDKWINRNAKP